MNMDDVTEQYIMPNIDKECERLGISPSFINAVKGMYPKYSGFCEPIYDNDGANVIKVNIRLDNTKESKLSTLMDFWHEMYHAKGYYYRADKHSEMRTNFYEWRRAIEYIFGLVRNSFVTNIKSK